jgi:hypothetical protein
VLACELSLVCISPTPVNSRSSGKDSSSYLLTLISLFGELTVATSPSMEDGDREEEPVFVAASVPAFSDSRYLKSPSLVSAGFSCMLMSNCASLTCRDMLACRRCGLVKTPLQARSYCNACFRSCRPLLLLFPVSGGVQQVGSLAHVCLSTTSRRCAQCSLKRKDVTTAILV